MLNRRRFLSSSLLTALPLAMTPSIRAQDTATPPTANDGVYLDPAGRFSMPIPPGWSVEEAPGLVLLRAPDGDLNVAALVARADDAGDGIVSAWSILDATFDATAITPERTEIPSDPGVDQTVVLTYDLGQTSGRVAQGIGQRIGDQVYVLIFRGELETVVSRQSEINVIVTGFRILAKPEASLVDSSALSLDEERQRSLEAFITETMAAFNIPGLSVVVVQGGQVAYAEGFGVCEEGGSQSVTPDTLMMVGSITKSFTTMMMGTMVDAGLIGWDEPVVQILPTFAVSNPDTTPEVTVRDLVCACLGVPRRDAEVFFNANDLTPENVIASVAGFPLATGIGETFQYNNQLVAAGGYIAALAAGGEMDSLHEAYVSQVQARVLQPIGMSRSGFDPDAISADPDHAVPHGITLDGAFLPMPLVSETAWTGPLAPAGGLWSSANELARYVMTELRRGVSADGTRVISPVNLVETWTPQVAVSSTVAYGLGWFTEQWKGLKIIRHGGNTRGFTSDIAFLPDADLGMVVLTNAQDVNAVAVGIRQRVLELLYDQPSEAESQVRASLSEQKLRRDQLDYGDPIDPPTAQALTGTYRNADLGVVQVTFTNGALAVDTGEFRSALAPLRQSPPGSLAFVVAEPSFVGYPVRFDIAGASPRLIVGVPPEEYTFERIPGSATPVARRSPGQGDQALKVLSMSRSSASASPSVESRYTPTCWRKEGHSRDNTGTTQSDSAVSRARVRR